MRQTKQFLASGAVLALAIATTSPALAQAQAQPQASADSAGAPEIIVTANKREQSANSVGLTIQAATAADLGNRGIAGPADLSKLVPGFTFTQSIYSTPVYTLRGIGLYDATFGAAPSVSVYSDQIPRNVPVMSDALDLDVERVEVLKGPQGTLFGQSSTGGAVNYIMGKPTKDFHAGMNASFERFNRAELSGFVSGPLGDKVSARLAVKGVSGGAWQRSISRPDDTNGDERKIMGRLTVDIEPTDGVKIELMATGSRDHSDPLAPQYTGSYLNYYPSAGAAAGSANAWAGGAVLGNPYGVVNPGRYADLTTPGSAGFNPYYGFLFQPGMVARLNIPNMTPDQLAHSAYASLTPAQLASLAAGAQAILGTPIRNDARSAEWTSGFLRPSQNSYYQFAGRIDVDVTPTITLTSITAAARSKLDYNQSLDGTTASVANVSLFGHVTSFNQEVRLAGNTEALHWIIGGSYDKLTTAQNNYFYLDDYSGSAVEFGEYFHIRTTLNEFTSRMRSYAFFGNAEYKVTDNLTVQGGVRYTDSKQNASYCYNDPASDTNQGTAHYYSLLLGAGPLAAGDCFPIDPATGHSTVTPVNPPALKEHNVSFRAGVNYKFDQGTLLYAVVSQGYKAGTFSAIGASRISQYTPAVQEKVVAYEAGFKAPLLDRKVQLNGAAFYYDYTNKQVRGRISDPVFGTLEKMLNVPKSYIWGIEGELVVRPMDGLTLSGSATYLKTKVTSDYSTTPDGIAVYNAQGYTGNFKGSELPYSPKFSANADVQYQFPVSDSLHAFVGGTLVYQGKQNATFSTDALPGSDFVIPSYATLDLRAGMETADGHWRLQVYGRNVTNKVYTTGVSSYLDTNIRYRGKPSIYGASVAYRF
ncbi:TonB-dependent receptor [Novosphingobium percolationis]|uniref:TonB-dependent receptor n=1 Tax=Novosphingobium percolationis TaxID=2871811 RepID=UPI001CD2F4CE|nr:TonB-dependent receptor [Novosphingobium percolationis]